MKASLQVGVALAVLVSIIRPETVFAYGGPGSVISGIGAFLAAVAVLLASLFGFIWFPLKWLFKSLTKEDAPKEEPATGAQRE